MMKITCAVLCCAYTSSPAVASVSAVPAVSVNAQSAPNSAPQNEKPIRRLAPAYDPNAAPSPVPAPVPSIAPTQPPASNPRRTPAAVAQANRIDCVFTETRPADAPRAESDADRDLEQLGRLVYAEINVTINDLRIHDVLRMFRRALGINLIVFEQRDGVSGIDGDQLISIELENVTGVDLIEQLAAMVGLEVTWQINHGTVEFGTKKSLARQGARRRATYETTDLALEPPDYRGARMGQLYLKSYNRRDSDQITGELVRMISSECEPEAFSPPPQPMVEDANGVLVPVRHTSPSRPPKLGNDPGSGRGSPNTTATRNFDPRIAQIFVEGKWAAIQVKDNNLVVLAPDFVHRAINGYPRAIPPRAKE